jgi:hypothetical protein
MLRTLDVRFMLRTLDVRFILRTLDVPFGVSAAFPYRYTVYAGEVLIRTGGQLVSVHRSVCVQFPELY